MESSSSPQMTLVHDCESGQSLSWPARQAQDEQTHPELLQSLHGVSARSEGVGAGPATPSQLQGPRGHTEALGRSVCCLSVFTTVPGFPGTLVGGGPWKRQRRGPLQGHRRRRDLHAREVSRNLVGGVQTEAAVQSGHRRCRASTSAFADLPRLLSPHR